MRGGGAGISAVGEGGAGARLAWWPGGRATGRGVRCGRPGFVGDGLFLASRDLSRSPWGTSWPLASHIRSDSRQAHCWETIISLLENK